MRNIGFGKAGEEMGVAWATFFYVGKSRWAPGTCGSLAALPLAWLVWSQMSRHAGWAFTLAVFLTGTLAAKAVIKRTGNTDHQSIVIDEVVGILITTGVGLVSWKHFLAAFVLFRLFDITKPWPVSWMDRNWKSALGTMLDDVGAALMASGVFWLLLRFVPSLLS
ncbi:MAG: phosphatidylglycerophosphatase A family protein [Bdellovibrionota bacterium]